MGFKLVRVDATQPYKVLLPIGSHFIGRGKFLDCNDNRVSRNHAELIVTKDSVLLKSLHQNPCFLKKKSSTDTIIFSQPDSQVLTNGDQFGLIPDSYWYEVIQYTRESTEMVESEDVSSKNENLNNRGNENGDKESDTQFYNHEEEDDMLNCSESLLDGAVNAPFNLPPENHATHNQEPGNGSENRPPDHLHPTFTHQPVESANQNEDLTDASLDSIDPANEPTRVGTPKRVHSEENSPCDVKRVKTEPLDEDEAKMQSNNATLNPAVKIEPSSSQDQGPSNDQEVKDEAKTQQTDATSNQAVKKEPSSPQDAKPGPSNDQGGSSNNGNGNPSTTPQSPTKPPHKFLRERCMYGANCYRRNPQHKAQFSHPTDADWGTGARGVCPWGAACVKADPRHWRDHDHPPGLAAPQPRPPRAHRPARRRRQRSATPESDGDGDIGNLIVAGKRVRRQIARQDASDSSASEEDPYHTDDSDEWEPPNSDYGSQDSGMHSQSQDI